MSNNKLLKKNKNGTLNLLKKIQTILTLRYNKYCFFPKGTDKESQAQELFLDKYCVHIQN